MLKKILKIVSGLALILLTVFLAIYFFVKGHKEEVVNFLVHAISENHKGTVNFDDISMSAFGSFPSPAFHIKNMVLKDSSEFKHTRFEVKEAFLGLAVNSLLKKKIQVKSVHIKHATYTSVTNKENLSNPAPNNKSPANEKKTKESFTPYQMDLTLEDVTIDIRNISRNKNFNFKLNEVSSKLNIGRDKITSTLELDAAIGQLGFNLEKGSYLKDSEIKGSMNPEIDLQNHKIHIPSFDLSINDQVFKLAVDFDTANKSSFLFEIVNEHTQYAATTKLVAENIQQKLMNYVIDRPFSTHTTISGTFEPFSNPLVHIDFTATDNSAKIIDRFVLDSLSFEGNFTNRIYDDARAEIEDKKDLKLIFDKISGKYRETHFQLTNASLKSTPEDKANIKGLLNVKGNPNDLISLFEDPIFTLKEGRFSLDADIEGDGTSIAALLSTARIALNVTNTSLYDKESDISLPVKDLKIHLNDDIAVLDILELPMNTGDKLLFDGQINHFSSILSKDVKNKASTKLNIRSPKLNWDDFINLFNSTSKSSKENVKPPQYVLYDILNKINKVYSPSVNIAIKEFGFQTLILENLATNLSFKGAKNLHLSNMSFDIPSGTFKLNADLNYKNEEEIIVSAALEANGTPEILNDLFSSDTFIFKNGSFVLKADINGDVMSLDNLLLKANSTLNFKDGTILYKPINLIVPINLMDVTIQDNRAILNELQISIGPEDKLHFSGELDDITAFITSNPDKQVNSSLSLQSTHLQWGNFIKMFDNSNIVQKDLPYEAAEVRLKKTLRGIYSKFNPRINISFDQFEFKDVIVLKNLSTGFKYTEINNLQLEESSFDFSGSGKANFSAILDISQSDQTLLNMDLKIQADPEELNELLDYDTFLLKGGELSLTAQIKGDVENLDQLITSSTSVFKIENSSLIHSPSGTHIPFSIMELDIIEDDAILKSFLIKLPNGDQIALNGALNNITSMLPIKTSKNRDISSNLHVYSKKIRFSDFMDLFNFDADSEHKKTPHRAVALKNSLRDFYIKYKPELTIELDEFIYNDLVINNFNTGFYFETEDRIYLENTKFNFYKGKVNLDAYLDITDPFETHFAMGFSTDKIDLEKLLSSFDHFSIPSLKEADKIDGKVSINTQLEGSFKDSTVLNSNSLKGTIGFNLDETEIKGFDPIIKVANIIFKKARFENIRFSPINNVLYVANNIVEIPLMEIQSTAFNFFVEGQLGYAEKPTNIWTAIPLTNFKSRDIVNIPDKTGYIEAGKKIYVEAKRENDQKIKYNLHLSDKKYYQERDSLNQYKTRFKEEKLMRRKYKRDSRKEDKSRRQDTLLIN